jgi:MFS transporter, DHA1 family, solute carrier family 18 (vesicular amine transporter), member 1/2
VTARGRPESRRGAVTAIAVAAVAIDSALLGLIAPLLPDIQDRTGAGDAALGLVLAAYAIPIVVLSLPLGRAADSIGRRTLLMGGLVLIAAGSVLIAASHGIVPLVSARAVQGIGSAASWIAALALVSDTAPPEKRGETLGVALGATGVGAIAGPALGGITAQAISFEAPFLICCALALGLLVAVPIVLEREARREAASLPALPAILRAMHSGSGVWGAGILLASAGVLGLVEVVAPLDLEARLALASGTIGLLFAGSIAVDAVMSPFGGRWGDRRGRRVPAVAGLALSAVSVGLLAILPGIAGAAVALATYGAGFSLAMAASVPWLDEAMADETRGLGYGVQNLLYAGGYTVGPILGGVLLGALGADLSYALTAAALGIGAVALLLAG